VQQAFALRDLGQSIDYRAFSPDRGEQAMSVTQAVRDLVGDTVESMELATRNGFHLEPRCRVCRNDQVRKKVNDLLATGSSYAMIVRALAADNAELDKCDRVTVDSIRNHCGRHFPVQNVAKATYREILERRAKANGVDFVAGVATAITPLAFFEIVAAGRLQSLIDSRDYNREIAELNFQFCKIREAVKSTVPEEMWGGIIEKLEEFEQRQEAIDVGTDSYDDDDDEPFDPTEFAEDDDEF
jgi:hypothetical protein